MVSLVLLCQGDFCPWRLICFLYESVCQDDLFIIDKEVKIRVMSLENLIRYSNNPFPMGFEYGSISVLPNSSSKAMLSTALLRILTLRLSRNCSTGFFP